MNAQILYATMSGHSKKIAEAIAKSMEIPIHNLKDNPQIPACDLLIIVGGIYAGQYKNELLEFVKKLSPSEIKKAALVTSSMRCSTQGSLRTTLCEAGIAVEDEEYLCKGSFLFIGLGHPNKSEIEGAVAFAKKMLEG